MTSFRRLDTRIILILVALLAVAWLQWPRLADEFRVDEDFRYYYWMYRFQDSSFFPEEKFDEGFLLVSLPWDDILLSFHNPGFDLLFYAASFLIPPPTFSNWLPFFLMPVTVLYLFKFGQAVRNHQTGILLALGFLFINLASSSSISIANGLQRSFATTFIIIQLYYLQQKRYPLAALVLILSALIYAPSFALNVIIWGFHAIKLNWPLRFGKVPVGGGWPYLVSIFCLATILLSPVLLPRLQGLPPTSAQVLSAEDVSEQGESSPPLPLLSNPVYQRNGAYPLFIIFPLVGRGGLVDLGEDLINLLILLLVSGLIWLVLGQRAFRLPFVVWALLWATLLMFILSWLAIWLTNSFLLYLPSRYTRMGIYLFLIFFVFLNGLEFLKEAPTLIQRHPRRLVWLLVAVETLIIGLVVGYPSQWARVGAFNMKWLLGLAGVALGGVGLALFKSPSRPAKRQITRIDKSPAGRLLIGLAGGLALLGWAVYAPLLTEVSYLNPTPAERRLLTFLETLPKDALIGGSPCSLDSVQLLARRQVFLDCENPGSGQTVVQAFDAYYSETSQAIVDFCQMHGIDYLVVDLDTYTPDYLARGRFYFDPDNPTIRALVSDRDTFVLAHVPDTLKLFQAENYFVVACDDLVEMG